MGIFGNEDNPFASLTQPRKKRTAAAPLPGVDDPDEDTAPIVEPDESAFESGLRYLGRLGYGVRNVLSGNLEGAARQGLDILGDTVDAFLPGDLIPEASRRGRNGQPNDYTEGSDLVGGMEPGLAKLSVDLGIGLATDPLTYLGVGAVANAAKGAKAAKALTFGVPFSKSLRTAIPGTEGIVEGAGKAITAITPPVVSDALGKAGAFGRRLIGDESKVAPWARSAVQSARDLSSGSAMAQEAALRPILAGLSEAEGQALLRSIQNSAKGADGVYRPLVPEAPNSAVYDATAEVAGRTGANGDAAAIKATNDATITQQAIVPNPLAAMLGDPGREAVTLSGAKVADPLEAAIMQQGGATPELASIGAKDMPELFTNWKSYDQQVADITAGLKAQGIQGEQLARLTESAQQWVAFTGRAFKELVEEGGFQTPIGRDLTRESPQYAMRMFTGPETDLQRELARRVNPSGKPKASAARSLRDSESLADYRNANPDIKLEEGLGPVAAERSAQQATMLGRTQAAKGMTAEFAKRAEAKMEAAKREYSRVVDLGMGKSRTIEGWENLPAGDRALKAGLNEAERLSYEARWAPLYAAGDQTTDLAKAANAVIEEVIKSGDTATAEALISVYRGLAPREGLMKVLASSNRLFKRFATAGAFIPRLNFSVRNVITGGGSQVLANELARPALGKYAKSMPSTILRSIDDGLEELTGKRVFRSENEFAQANEAIRLSNGSVRDAAAGIKDPIIREAFEDGVITGGFIQAEDLARAMNTSGWKKWIKDLRDWPAAIAKGTEQRMRATVYRALREDGLPREQAAQAVRDTFFDYTMTNSLNRTARDVIPFFTFTAKSIPQTLKLMAEQPSVAVGARTLFSQDSAEDPVYPWMRRQALVPLGKDEEGNADYLTSLGLPLETLTNVPNASDNPLTFLSQARSGVLGQANPLIKTAIAAGSGTDPFFGTPFLSYDKAPAALQAIGVPERGEVGRWYNALAGTGLIQPLASPVQYLSGLADERRNVGEKALGALTGARIESVDEDKALQQMLTEYLRKNPSVASYQALYDRGNDPEVARILSAISEIKKRRSAASGQ